MSTSLGRPYIRAVPAVAPRMARRMRRPVHNGYIHTVPWVLTPFFAAPVLPGETLKNLLFQARVITTPLTSQMLGWWAETYWFYVKHRHMAGASVYTSMMLDLNTATTAQEAGAAEARMNETVGDIMFVKQAYNAVIDEYFRGDGETYATAEGIWSGALCKARLNYPGWWDSILPDASLTTSFGGIADDSIGGANTALDQLGEIGRALETWQQLRMLGITNLEYDDYLRSYGVVIAAPQDDRPELIRYTREWTYPATTVSVDATAQRTSSVASWTLTERADKDRYFKEPGVLIGMCCFRPKLYHSKQQAGIGMLKSATAWQPPFAAGTYDQYQPVVGMSGYNFDSADLFNRGDQWTYAMRGSLPQTLTFPTDGKFDYADGTLINGLFADGASGFIKMDASISLQVATGAVAPDATPVTT